MHFSAHRQSCGNVIFSVLCVSHSVTGVPYEHYSLCMGPHLGPSTISGYNNPPPPQRCSLWNMYGWQAGSWHPIGMHSCRVEYFLPEEFFFLKQFMWLPSKNVRKIHLRFHHTKQLNDHPFPVIFGLIILHKITVTLLADCDVHVVFLHWLPVLSCNCCTFVHWS